MRLTEKAKEFKDEKVYLMPVDNELKALDKLGQLEDIEERWRIDLVNRICFFKNSDNQIMQVNIIGLDFRNGTIIVETEQKTNMFALKQTEYRTKWALTKKELENK